MAEAAVSFATEALGNLLIEEAEFLHGVSDEVEELRLDLDRLRSFLRDAEARQDENRVIKEWISQTRNLAYEAEDLLEKYAFKIPSQRENILKRTVCFLNECYVRRSIGSEVQKLRSKISDLTISFQEYGIIRTFVTEGEGSSSSSEQQLRRAYSHVVEDDFIKLDNDVEMLVGHLVNENDADCHGVVSICGMGGLGKTTLARKVYNHPKVRSYFENLVWVCISQQWQKREILQGILIKFFPTQRDEIIKWRDEELMGKLLEILRKKKCLVVLDDIWSTDAWECIKAAFPVTKEGSKLLLTTRIRGVALHIGPNGFHHEPRLLSDLESWELLQTKALRERTCLGPEEMHIMEQLGKEMVKHCGGLPLAVVILGGILATRSYIKEWESVHKNVKAYIESGSNYTGGEVQKILALSYNNLPPKLKACFLYLSRFPEDSDINLEMLYQLWIAEGMISVEDQIAEESMMDVAERYLVELAERSMVQVKVDEDMCRYELCRLHILMRGLSLEKAKEEKFFLHIDEGFDDSGYNQIHRVSIHFSEEHDPKYFPCPNSQTKHLRSLVLLNYCCEPRSLIDKFSGSRMLRVLEIELGPWKFGDFKLPDAVGNLVYLRYLGLRGVGYTRLWLPSSIVNLQRLQTLYLQDFMGVRIPIEICKMRQIRHLYLPVGSGSDKLRLDGLNKLEILKGFSNKFYSAKSLLKSTNLRLLRAELYVEHDDISEIITFISESTRLRHTSLSVHFPVDHYDSTIREKCSTVAAKLFSCRNLHELCVFNRISHFPKYDARDLASELVSLSLQQTATKDDPMGTLERLPNLRSLSLKGGFIGTEMECSPRGFPQLRHLSLCGARKLENWIIAEGAMPNLSLLTISCCWKLEMIPDGLIFIKNLKELDVRYMLEEFQHRLQVIDGREGVDFDKVRHVPLIIC